MRGCCAHMFRKEGSLCHHLAVRVSTDAMFHDAIEFEASSSLLAYTATARIEAHGTCYDDQARWPPRTGSTKQAKIVDPETKATTREPFPHFHLSRSGQVSEWTCQFLSLSLSETVKFLSPATIALQLTVCGTFECRNMNPAQIWQETVQSQTIFPSPQKQFLPNWNKKVLVDQVREWFNRIGSLW